MLQCRPGTVKKAVFVTVPGLQRTMSGREDAPKLLMLRCARDTQLTHLFLDRPLAGAVRLVIARDDFAARPVDCGGGAQCLCSGACIKNRSRPYTTYRLA